MVSSPESLVALALLTPFVGALAIPLFGNAPNIREGVTLVSAIVLCGTVLALLGPVMNGARPGLHAIDVAPGLALAFRVEPLGMLFALVAACLWIVNSIYSIGYMRANKEPHQTRFYVCFAVALGSTIGIAFAQNLFTLFLFYEMLTLSTYPLVAHKGGGDAIRAGRIYLLMLLGTSLFLFLPAIIATWLIADTLDFAPGGILANKVDAPLAGALLALYVFGVGKAAVMPLHFWLPAAMVAPTPVSALLHAVAVVKAGVFTILKVGIGIFGVDTMSTLGQSTWLTVVAGATIIAASIAALRQDNLKRRLAYSTVSQLSYVILGLAVLAPISVIGAAMHLAAHAVGKITLFFAAGSIYTVSHLTEISQLDGIGRRMPWTMGAFAIGALAMIGLPPTAGFIGKWLMLSGAMQSGNWLALLVMIVSTILNAAYFLPIVFRAFFAEPVGDGHEHSIGEAPWPILFAIAITATATVILFFMPNVPYALATRMIER